MMLAMPGPDTRGANLERLERETFDLCIIGGGITGAGVALDAASRGLSVALVDKGDFASGTSSKSSKMIHGGLRYLAQYEFGLTWEASRERDLLRRIAPHLVRPLRFLFPAYRKGIQTRFATLGLSVYDVLAAGRGFGRHRRAGDADIRMLAPTLDPKRVVGAWTYWDASTDDARLVFEVLRTAHGSGAAIANYSRVDGFDFAGGRIFAANVVEETTGREFPIRARCFLNAGGVWADQVGRLSPGGAPPPLRPAKGIHLVVPLTTLPVGCGVVIPSVARDGRSMFVVPWSGNAVIGTTDTEFDGPLDQPSVNTEDVEYMLSAVNWSLGVDVSPTDVVAAWAGLRPLRAGAGGPDTRTADLSRKHHLSVSSAGLVSITGGKLTTYRRMAVEAVDLVCSRLGARGRSSTRRLPIGLARPLAGVTEETVNAAAHMDVGEDVAHHLVQTYGDRAPQVLALAAEDEGLAEPIVPGLPWLAAEAVWAVRHEMAVTLGDVLERRTRLSLSDRHAGLLSDAPALVAREAAWAPEQLASEIRSVRDRISAERGPVASLGDRLDPARSPGSSPLGPEAATRADRGGEESPSSRMNR